jgi:CoA:oxalate CoA-transferase
MTEAQGQPLAGIRVLDLGQIYLGGYVGLLLADAGADVVKVEPPSGENLRNRPREHGGRYPFAALNRNKRSIVADLKTDDGRELLLRLVRRADVLLENYTPGVMERLRLGYDVVRAENPRLVYASGSGYGSQSAYSALPAMDLTVQAMTGVISVTGFAEHPPVKAGVAIADFMAGTHLYGAILTGLLQREKTGVGCHVEVSMVDSTLPALLSSLAVALGTPDEEPMRTGNRHGGLAEAPYNVFRAVDGYVAIICVSDEQWRRLAEAIGRPEMGVQPEFASRDGRVLVIDEVDAAIAEWTARRTRATIVERLFTAGVPVAPVRTLREVALDQDLSDRGTFVTLTDPELGELQVFRSPIRFDDTELLPVVPPPCPGEHLEEVLKEWLDES